MLKTLLRAALGGFVAMALTIIAFNYFLKPQRQTVRRADEGRDDLSEEQQEQLLRELGSLT